MILRLTHVACCIERSEAAELAVSEAARLAASWGRFTLVHVAPPVSVLLGGLGGWGVDERNPLGPARRWLEERRAEIPGAEAQLLSGDPPGEIAARWARDAGVDLIVSTAHQSRVQRALLGSFSRDLVYAADCPVLIARPGPAPPTQGAPGPGAKPYRHIAACLDHTQGAGGVIEMARELGRGGSDALSVVHVVAPPRPAPRRLVARILPMPAGCRIRASRMLRRVAAECEGADTVLLAGHPAQAACEWAASAGVDLLVIAPRDHQPRGLGGFAAQVARSAPCSVLVVRDAVRSTDGGFAPRGGRDRIAPRRISPMRRRPSA